jgi:hypothetical protein
MMHTLAALESPARNQLPMDNLERLMLVEGLVEDCSRHLEHFSCRIYREPLCANFKMICQIKDKVALVLEMRQVRFHYEPIPPL